jgi:hypothetical protein
MCPLSDLMGHPLYHPLVPTSARRSERGFVGVVGFAPVRVGAWMGPPVMVLGTLDRPDRMGGGAGSQPGGPSCWSRA